MNSFNIVKQHPFNIEICLADYYGLDFLANHLDSKLLQIGCSITKFVSHRRPRVLSASRVYFVGDEPLSLFPPLANI